MLRVFYFKNRQLIYGAIIVIFFMGYFLFSDAGVDQVSGDPPMELSHGWKFRWGDSPINQNGEPEWLVDGISSPHWKDFNFSSPIAETEKNYVVAWFAIEVPQKDWKNPTIYFDIEGREIDLFLDRKLIYSHNAALGFDPPIGVFNRLAVPLHDDCGGKVLALRIYDSKAGFKPQSGIIIGSHEEVIKRYASAKADSLLLGIFFIVFGFVIFPLTIYMNKYDKPKLIVFCIFILSIGIWYVTQAPIINFIIREQPAVWAFLCYITVFLIPAFLLFYFQQIFVSVNRIIIRRLWQIDIAFFVIFLGISVTGMVTKISVWNGIILLLNIFYIKVAVDLAVIIASIFKSALKGDIDARILAISFLIFSVFAIADLLKHMLGVYNPEAASLSKWGMLIIVVGFVLIMGRRFFDIHRQLVVYSNELEAKNKKLSDAWKNVNEAKHEVEILNKTLEERVVERTRQLEEANLELSLVNIKLMEMNNELKETMEELKATQNQLIQSEKMAALGGLVAGVAHEINTPVGNGVTAASHLEEETQAITLQFENNTMKKSSLEQYMKKCSESSRIILKNLNRASELVRSFKMIAVDQSNEEVRKFKIREYIDEVLVSLTPQLKRTRHNILLHCSQDLAIDSYPGAISQIITNLVMNSIIHAYEKEDEGNIVFDVTRQEDEIVFKYSDDGKGIDKEHLDKIFEPFFTTRRSKGGTGLGLNIVYNIVTQKLLGKIVCESEPGKGTTFIISFPVSVEAYKGCQGM